MDRGRLSESERGEIYRNGDEGEVGGGGAGNGWWGLFTVRIIHYFFLPQYFLSLICLLFFKLDPEPCPPAESLAQRRGGLGQLQASLEPCARRWRGWRKGRGVVVDGGRDRERRRLREAVDDSVSAAEDIALRDTTRGP